ncbi:MAG: 2-C-methyl-D-erythritol 2,4-cyclodiphosphate synthase [bacterium P3]|nr:MAG: 2-C-methyl-D-erythritol 2,4-cyclodiphosphate synthase [bacterium P3]KWW42280.1 MAG: 2-C-methyl-D-erythritol 2,4-cyclodiphosphate synthase [bacterium F083]
MTRIGIGYDVHRLTGGRPLWIGGIEVPHTLGLDGHSDADVLIHAICDALLGAAALGDIGKHFPDNDNRYKDIDSKILLRRCTALLQEHGYRIVNIDSIVCAQQPKLSPYIEAMRTKLAEVMQLPVGCISVKATTTEHLGFEGREEGISAHAAALIEQI